MRGFVALDFRLCPRAGTPEGSFEDDKGNSCMYEYQKSIGSCTGRESACGRTGFEERQAGPGNKDNILGSEALWPESRTWVVELTPSPSRTVFPQERTGRRKRLEQVVRQLFRLRRGARTSEDRGTIDMHSPLISLD